MACSDTAYGSRMIRLILPTRFLPIAERLSKIREYRLNGSERGRACQTLLQVRADDYR